MTHEEYKKAKEEGKSVYERAKQNNLTKIDRWSAGIDHHPKSLELMEFIAAHDFNDYGDCSCWNIGGDGDNGETLMYEMDAYFEQKDIDEKNLKSENKVV